MKKNDDNCRAMKFSKLELQIQKLIHLHQQCLEDNKQLSAKIRVLEEKTEYQKKLIAELEEKYSAVKLSQTMHSDSGNEGLKQRLDEYIAEIDKCLSVLNNKPL